MTIKSYRITDNLNSIRYEGKIDRNIEKGLEWNFELLLPDTLRIISDNFKKDIFVEINADLVNQNEIINTILKILGEYLV